MTVGRLTWLVDVLRKAGLTVVEYPGWETRGGDKIFNRMDPQTVGAHHTGTSTAWLDTSVEYLLAVKGNATTPPPLAHLGLRRSGVYVAIASGVANHGGTGNWKGITGNRRAVGIEAYNNGTGEPWPQTQLDAYDRGVAALLERLGRDASYLWGHKEYATPPGRKIDPFGIDMFAMRRRVQAIMEDEVSLTDCREQVAAAWFAASGEWMTATATESRQVRLSRLAGEVFRKERSAAQIASFAVRVKPSDPGEAVPAWVLHPDLPFP